MAKAVDYKLTGYDLTIGSNGDFARTDNEQADQQSVMLIANTNIGSWKASPLCGFGIIWYLGGSNLSQLFKRNLRVQLEVDGFSNVSILTPNPLNLSEYFVSLIRPNYE